jgi:hypothetical protein
MKNLIIAFVCSPVLLLASACASVQFYSDSGLTQKTGLKVSRAKPFLLVEYNSAKDNSVKSTVVWLPGEADAQYVVLKPGIGSHELKLAFEKGSLNSYGITAGSEIPETINSLASLISKTTVAAAAFGSGNEGEVEPSQFPVFELFEIVIEKGNTFLNPVTVSK